MAREIKPKSIKREKRPLLVQTPLILQAMNPALPSFYWTDEEATVVEFDDNEIVTGDETLTFTLTFKYT